MYLDTEKPVMYMEFLPHGRLKFCGTKLYPQHHLLTLQCSAANKSKPTVVCEDIFDALVTFPEVHWIGTNGENPTEVPLPFPDFLAVCMIN
jgi:hypothetical protein